jgi:putative FmdB family regulatory protein
MPLYEYQCDACGHRFELIRKYSDPPVEACPACGGTVQKLLSSPAIQFKGSGFYITDYARAGKSDGKGETASSKGDSDASSGASSPTKGDGAGESQTGTKPESQAGTKSDSKSETTTASKPSSPTST